jgi:hypothetical protein
MAQRFTGGPSRPLPSRPPRPPVRSAPPPPSPPAPSPTTLSFIQRVRTWWRGIPLAIRSGIPAALGVGALSIFVLASVVAARTAQPGMSAVAATPPDATPTSGQPGTATSLPPTASGTTATRPPSSTATVAATMAATATPQTTPTGTKVIIHFTPTPSAYTPPPGRVESLFISCAEGDTGTITYCYYQAGEAIKTADHTQTCWLDTAGVVSDTGTSLSCSLATNGCYDFAGGRDAAGDLVVQTTNTKCYYGGGNA